MKIAIITCRQPLHAGIALQTYALTEYLQEQGHSVEVIAYQPRYLRQKTVFQLPQTAKSRLLRRLRRWLPSCQRLRCARAFARFDRLYLPKHPYRTAKALHRQPPDAALYLTFGRVWDTWKKSGCDRCYYLSFAPKSARKAAYAASFSTSVPPEREAKRLLRRLRQLDAVGIREEHGTAFAERAHISAQTVCDPILLLRPLRWKPLYTEIRARLPYVFVWDADGDADLYALAHQLQKERGYQIVSGLPCRWASVCCDHGPQDVLSHIRGAALVLTQSYTALCCALLYEREFIVFPRKEYTNTRFYDLLDRLRLSDRLYSPSIQPWKHRTDYETARPLLDHWRRSSEAFLQEQLSACEDGERMY